MVRSDVVVAALCASIMLSGVYSDANVAAEAGHGDAEAPPQQEGYHWLVVPASCSAAAFGPNGIGIAGLLQGQCRGQIISRLLSLLITAGSLLLKAPQAAKIVAAGSATGLDPDSMYLDVLTFLITATTNFAHGYPLFSYGESVSILIQNIILVLMMWHYGGKDSNDEPLTFSASHKLFVLVGTLVWVAPVMYLYFTFGTEWQGADLPQWLLVYPTLIQSACIPLTAISRLKQVWTNYKQGHTGQLAVVTIIMNFAGAAARVFTTLQEGQAAVYLVGFVVGCSLSGVMLLQVILLWNQTNEHLAKEAAEAAKEQKAADAKKKS